MNELGKDIFGKSTTRRGFLKMFTPGGWVGEVRGKGGFDNLSPEARASLAKDGVLLALMAPALVSCTTTSGEGSKSLPLKEQVMKLKWKHLEGNSQLRSFTRVLAEEYLRLTQSPRISKEKLIGLDKTNFFSDRGSFLAAVQAVEPKYNPGNQWGYAHYDSGKVFIDLGTLKSQSIAQGSEAGLALLDALWHEWGHLDVSERAVGEYINNPEQYLKSPYSGQNERLQKYRGGAVYTATYYGFLRFEEVWNETITVRRMIEQVGLDGIISAGDYYQNGVDFFPRLTQILGISVEDLYQMHASSDFEELAKRIGQNLPGSSTPLDKGIGLFVGIHQSNREIVRKSGALELIK